MVNGNWVLRNRILLTLDQEDLLYHAGHYAKRIDTFLIEREQSVFSKLIALGGSSEAESFEIQLKVEIIDKSVITNSLKNSKIKILYHKHYHQHDSYFIFPDTSQGRLRYREDESIDDKENITNVRSRLTLLGPKSENNLENDVLLSRSRYLAPAGNSLRFYREYFKPSSEIYVEKDRLRWFVRYKETEFYINVDSFISPELGVYLEIKSRTWSLKDAENKALLTSELIKLLEGSLDKMITQDYIEVIENM
jgi:5-methylthioadenosine/S-adenosylhomocysteine deaminase